MSKKNKLINPKFEKKGYIQIYTGNGKGKTTASLGLTLRALGRNWKVLMVMFTKVHKILISVTIKSAFSSKSFVGIFSKHISSLATIILFVLLFNFFKNLS